MTDDVNIPVVKTIERVLADVLTAHTFEHATNEDFAHAIDADLRAAGLLAGQYRRVAYGEPVFRQPCGGPVWRHQCGNMTVLDLLDRDTVPWRTECAGCRATTPDGWRPVMVYDGPRCDQCHGNGWVPIGGRLFGNSAYATVTECTACSTTGVAGPAQAATEED